MTDDQNLQEQDMIPPSQESDCAPVRRDKPEVNPVANAACVVARGPGVEIEDAIWVRNLLHDLF